MEEKEYGVEKISIICDFSGTDLTRIFFLIILLMIYVI
jgi:hypothetical protein